MSELKKLSKEAIPAALEKAERYRLLNEPGEAESICLDILAIDPENQRAIIMLLLALTVALAYLPLGGFNPAAAVGIAAAKAIIIILYFMHVRHSRRLVWVVAGVGFFWLCLMFAITFGDYLTRAYLPAPTLWQP